MKSSFIKLILVLTVITVSHAAGNRHRHREDAPDQSGRFDRDTHEIKSKLRTIDNNVDKLIDMVKTGFNLMSKKLNKLYELISMKTAKIPANDFQDVNIFENITNASFNDTDIIEDDIDFDACRPDNAAYIKNGSGVSSYEQHGASEYVLHQMNVILPKAQPSLESITLINLEIYNEILLKSLQFSCNLENLTLTNVKLTFLNSNSSNSTDGEIYLPKLQKYVIELNRETKKLYQSQIFPFTKNGSKWNTDITYRHQSVGLRIIPNKGRIESEYILFNQQILPNLEPDFELKELLVTSGSRISVDDFPSTLKLLSLKYTNYGSLELGNIVRNATELQHFQNVDYSQEISTQVKLADMPETLESLILVYTYLQYSPDVKFTKLERLSLNLDDSKVEPELIKNIENIFPNLKTVVMFNGGPVFEKLYKLSSVKQFLARKSDLQSVSPDNNVKGCRTTWCHAVRDDAGNTVNENVFDLGELIHEIFPEYKTVFDR